MFRPEADSNGNAVWTDLIPFIVLRDNLRKIAYLVNRHFGPLLYDATDRHIVWGYPPYSELVFLYFPGIDTELTPDTWMARYRAATTGYSVNVTSFAIASMGPSRLEVMLDAVLARP